MSFLRLNLSLHIKTRLYLMKIKLIMYFYELNRLHNHLELGIRRKDEMYLKSSVT